MKSIKEIDWFEFNNRKRHYYGAVKVKIRLDDLESIMRAAKKTIIFYTEHDTYLGSGLTVDAKEMAEAFKRVSQQLKEIQQSAATNAEHKVAKEYIVKK